MRTSRGLMLFALAVPLLTAQSFEVASVKRAAPESGSAARRTGGIPRQTGPARIDYPGVSLLSVLMVAYGVQADQIAGPQWLRDEL